MRLDAAVTELSYAKDWTPASKRWYAARLEPFVQWANQAGASDIEDVTAPLVRRYVEFLRAKPTTTRGQVAGPPMDSHTLHGHVRAVRAFLFWAASEDLLDEKVPKRIALPKREQKVLAILSDDQITRLLREAARTDTPARDSALVALLLDTGCRASELCGLTLDDVTFTADSAWLLVHGKGRKQREVALGKKARAALHRYIHRERTAPFTQRAVFLGKKGPLTPEGLDRLLYRLRDEAGAEHFAGVSVGAHRWRHTHAVKALEAGMDVYAVSRQMGHSDISVTANSYLHAVSARQLRQMTISPLDKLGR